jgi:asparagine synthase (glutamine-hydrolysing)
VFADLFEDSVRLRMRSDVPVGVCLSGGLDSTSIMCTMADIRHEHGSSHGDRLQAFCYQSPDFDEGTYVSDTLVRANAELNRLEIDERRLWDLLPTVLSFHDEPLHSPTALIGFELMRLASARGVKVVLNGQGADETLAGYRTYFTTHWQTLAASGRLTQAMREIRAYTNTRGGSWMPLLAHAFRTGWHARVRRAIGAQGTANRNPWLTPDFCDTYAECTRRIALPKNLSSSLKQSVRLRPLPLYLRIEDRNAMAHSVEARLPFLDPRLVSFAFTLPSDWKIRGPWNKYVLREAMRGRIPESVRTRVDKLGFPTSSRQWFKGVWYQPMMDLLNSTSFRERGIFDVEAVRRDFSSHRNGEIDVSANLFHAAQLELWLEREVPSTSHVVPAHGSSSAPAQPVTPVLAKTLQRN